MKFSINDARQLRRNNEYRTSLLHYLTVLKTVDQVRREKYIDEVVDCLKRFVEELPDDFHDDSLIAAITELFGNIPSVVFQIALLHYKSKRYLLSLDTIDHLYKKCNPSETQLAMVRYLEHNVKSNVFPSWHLIMINDQTRNNLFHEAIRRSVKESDVVVDIGSGTGLLSIICSRYSSNVTAIEENTFLSQLSMKIIDRNLDGTSRNRLQLINKHSKDYNVENDEKATVIISETLDCCGVGEEIITTFLDAHDRLAAPNCVFIPSSFITYIVLYECKSINDIHRFDGFVSRYCRARHYDDEEPYWCTQLEKHEDARALSKPIPLLDVDLTDRAQLEWFANEASGSLSVEVTSSGEAHCFVSYFTATLYEDVILETSSDDPISWDKGIFMLESPLTVQEGDQLPVKWNLDKNSRLVVAVDDLSEQEDTEEVVVVDEDDIALLRNIALSEEVIDQLPCDLRRILSLRPMLFTMPFVRSGLYKTRRHVDNFECMEELVKNDLTYEDGEIGVDAVVSWPIRADGSLNEQLAQRMVSVVKDVGAQTLFPNSVLCQAQLISCNFIDRACRPQPSTHCGVDLHTLDDFSLFEYRNLGIDKIDHCLHSDVFDMFDFNFIKMADDEAEVYTKVLNVECSRSGTIDGLVYWWTTGNYSSKQSKRSAFVLKKRLEVQKGDTVSLRLDVCNCQMVVTLESRS